MSYYNWPKFLGPLATVVFTVVYHWGSLMWGYPINAVWVTLFVILGTFTSGLRGGMLAAAWGSAYVVYAIDDLGRVVQIVPFLFLYALVIGWQTRRLRRSIVDELASRHLAEENQVKATIFDGMTNGNIHIFERYLKTLDDLRDGWEVIPDEIKLEKINQARGGIADLITLGKGFQEMAKQRGYVVRHEEST